MATVMETILSVFDDAWTTTVVEHQDYTLTLHCKVSGHKNALFGFSDGSSKEVNGIYHNTAAFMTFGHSASLKSIGFLVLKETRKTEIAKAEFYALMECRSLLKRTGYVFSDSLISLSMGRDATEGGLDNFHHVRAHAGNAYNVMVDILSKMITYGVPEFNREAWQKALDLRYIPPSDKDLILDLHHNAPEVLKKELASGQVAAKIRDLILSKDINKETWKPEFLSELSESVREFAEHDTPTYHLHVDGVSVHVIERKERLYGPFHLLIFPGTFGVFFYVANDQKDIQEIGYILNKTYHDVTVRSLDMYHDELKQTTLMIMDYTLNKYKDIQAFFNEGNKGFTLYQNVKHHHMPTNINPVMMRRDDISSLRRLFLSYHLRAFMPESWYEH